VLQPPVPDHVRVRGGAPDRQRLLRGHGARQGLRQVRAAHQDAGQAQGAGTPRPHLFADDKDAGHHGGLLRVSWLQVRIVRVLINGSWIIRRDLEAFWNILERARRFWGLRQCEVPYQFISFRINSFIESTQLISSMY
jgi:hypothetical protein